MKKMLTERDPTLTNGDHRALDKFFLLLMEAVRDGHVKPANAAAEVMHLLAAVDIANYGEPRAHAKLGAELIAELARQV